ncbi:adhesion G protein-coupled receptor E3, partial [Biomphalaria glabrata]
GDCLQLQCTPGKVLENGTCVTVFKEMKGLMYRLKALIVFKEWNITRYNLTIHNMVLMAESQ